MNPAHLLKPGVLYRGDNVRILADMPEGSVDLIYLDPPFFSNRSYEVIWGDESELRSFLDRWSGGIEVYIAWMRERMLALHRVLSPTGTLYLHCDWHASHYLKVMVDEVFGGSRHFQNEIVWYYRGGGVSKYRWGRRHDVLLMYTKSPKKTGWTFNVDPVRMEYSPESQERLKYTARSFRGDRVYENYRPNPLGKHPDDVWSIQPLMPSSRKKLGYPTQKPEALLQNVVLASSNPGDLVLDPFCGCGTTLSVAQQTDRDWVGIDISPRAIDVCQDRLTALGADPVVRGMPETIADLMPARMGWNEFQNWVCHQLHATVSVKKSDDFGVDGRMILTHDPVQVKQHQVGRPDVDAFQTAMERAGSDRGVMVGLGFSKQAREEVARARRKKGVEIIFCEAESLLKSEQRQHIVQQLQPGDAQLTIDEVLAAMVPRHQMSVEDLMASELRRQQYAAEASA
ncbi:MAG: DNA methyltransferase [Gaiellaceae bacterium]